MAKMKMQLLRGLKLSFPLLKSAAAAAVVDVGGGGGGAVHDKPNLKATWILLNLHDSQHYERVLVVDYSELGLLGFDVDVIVVDVAAVGNDEPMLRLSSCA
jgi:hypothetical protein